MATKSYLRLTPVDFEISRSEAFSAAMPVKAGVIVRWEIANVSGIVMSQVINLPSVCIHLNAYCAIICAQAPWFDYEGIWAFRGTQ